jgi:hypothetical protein
VNRRVSQAEVNGLKILTVPERQVVISVDCDGQAVKVEAVTLSECREQVNMKDLGFCAENAPTIHTFLLSPD